MPRLSEDAKRIVEAGRSAGLPSPEHGARMWSAVSRRIATGSSPSETVSDLEAGALGRAGAASAVKTGITIAAVVAALGAASVSLTRRPASDPALPRPSASPTSTASPTTPPGAPTVVPVAADTSIPADAPATPHSPVASPVRARRPESAARPRPATDEADLLARESQHIAEAQAALQRQNHAGALAALQRHAAEFPAGVLAQERDALQVLALCGLGRVEKARALARSFERMYPHSSHGARVQASCAGDPADAAVSDGHSTGVRAGDDP